MADCSASAGKYLGKRTLVEVSLDTCSDTYPTEEQWSKIGALTSKDLDFSGNTVESSADDNAGGFNETFVTNQAGSFTFAGEQKEVQAADELLNEIIQFRFDQMAQYKQPSLWLRVTTPARTYTFWVNFVNYSEANPTNELATYNLTFQATASTLPPKIEATVTP